MQPSAFECLLAGQVGIAKEIEMCGIAAAGERARESFHPDAQAAGLAVDVRALEAEKDEDRAGRVHAHREPPTIFSASACSSRLGAHRRDARVERSHCSPPSGSPSSVVATPPDSWRM